MLLILNLVVPDGCALSRSMARMRLGVREVVGPVDVERGSSPGFSRKSGRGGVRHYCRVFYPE